MAKGDIIPGQYRWRHVEFIVVVKSDELFVGVRMEVMREVKEVLFFVRLSSVKILVIMIATIRCPTIDTVSLTLQLTYLDVLSHGCSS